SPAQLWFFEQRLEQAHQFNQAVLLVARADVQPEHVEAALAAVLAQHDRLRLRFSSREPSVRASHQPHATLPLYTLDLPRGRRGGARCAPALAQASAGVQGSLALGGGPRARGAWLDLGRGERRLLLAAHDLVVDGVSWRILLEDLTRAGEQVPAARPIALPAK